MSISPEVVSTTNIVGILASGFTVGETVNFAANGTPFSSPCTANTLGTCAFLFGPASSEGYVVVTAQGVTSGKQVGGVFQVLNNAPQVPGLAIAPHAVAAGGKVSYLAVGYPPAISLTIAENTTPLGTGTTSNNGGFGYFYTNRTTSGGPGAVVLNTYRAGMAGTMSGQTYEVRPDATTVGDANPSRGLVTRPIVNATSGGVVIFEAEGFQANEPLTLSGCANSATTATANGSAVAPLVISPTVSSTLYQCTITGGSSGYVAYGAILADANATNAPSGIVSPSSTIQDANPLIVAIDRFPANQTGTIYVDGTAATVFTTTNTGFDTELINKPAALGMHRVLALANSGEIAIMPLWINTPACESVLISDGRL